MEGYGDDDVNWKVFKMIAHYLGKAISEPCRQWQDRLKFEQEQGLHHYAVITCVAPGKIESVGVIMAGAAKQGA